MWGGVQAARRGGVQVNKTGQDRTVDAVSGVYSGWEGLCSFLREQSTQLWGGCSGRIHVICNLKNERSSGSGGDL